MVYTPLSTSRKNLEARQVRRTVQRQRLVEVNVVLSSLVVHDIVPVQRLQAGTVYRFRSASMEKAQALST